MADDRSLRGPQDRQRINLSEDYEVAYWSKNGVSATSNWQRPSRRLGRCQRRSPSC
jgi:hypothetical protein